MKKFVSFHKIPQFADVIRNVNHQTQFVGFDDNGEPIYNPHAEKPILTFTGTVKIHGSCSSACTDGNEIWYQSRKRIITPLSDNYDFSQFCMAREKSFQTLLSSASSIVTDKNNIVSIFGEYCGNGIQTGVGISALPKMFVIFAVKISNPETEEASYIAPIGLRDTDNNIYNIYDFDVFQVAVDFNYPQIAQNKFVELVEKVEQQCPVAKAFGVEGIGEGIVWTAYYKDVKHVMKTKGQKHSASQVKKVASVDIEKVNSIQEFVDYAVTESRMEQAVQELFISEGIEPTIQKISDFLKWIMKDIAEEEMETLLKNGLVIKDIGKYVSQKAKIWYMNLLHKNIGLK